MRNLDKSSTDKEFFLLFANCIVTKGLNKAIIADLQKGTYTDVPHYMAEILIGLKNHPVKEYCKKNPNIDYNDLIVPLAKLERLDLGHFTDEPKAFPEIEPVFKSPFYIQDCIWNRKTTKVANEKKCI